MRPPNITHQHEGVESLADVWQSDWQVLYVPGLNHHGKPQRLPGLALTVNRLPVTMPIQVPAFKCSPFASTTPSTPMLVSCLNHPPSVYLRALPFQISPIHPPPQQLVSSLNHPPTVTIVYLLVSPRFHSPQLLACLNLVSALIHCLECSFDDLPTMYPIELGRFSSAPTMSIQA